MKRAIIAVGLIFAAAFVNAQNYFPIENENPEVIKLLHEAGCSINSKYYRGPWLELLWVNAPLSFYEKLLVMGKNYVEPEFHTSQDIESSPIVMAIERDNYEVVEFLISQGADVNRLKREYGATPLQILTQRSENPELFRLLLNAGAQIDPVKYYVYDTPFELILKKNNIELVRLFLDEGANIHRIDQHGRTPLEYAASYSSDPEIFRLLINRGANINMGGNGTPLHRAVANSKPENVALLIDLGADVNARDNRGNTPLMLARNKARPEIITLLLNAGAK